MLDIQFIRDNKDLVIEKSKQKGCDVEVARLLDLDEKRKSLIQEIEASRAKINLQTKGFEGKVPSEEQRAVVRTIKESISSNEKLLENIEADYLKTLKTIPNMPLDNVPIGSSEEENKIEKQVGEKLQFAFEPKTHWQIAQHRGWLDKERAGKVAGARFAYILGDLVKLQLAIMQFVIDKLTNESVIGQIIKDNNLDLPAVPFIPVLPPYMIKTEIYDAMDRLEPRDDRYKIEGEELWLQGSAEHTIGSMLAGEVIDEKQDGEVQRYLGYATSFRKEAGTYGKDTEGIIRMHQFDKLEMESFSVPEKGLGEFKLMIALQEYLTSQLGLPYQILNKCTADIGKPNASGVDLEVWMPGQNKYRETHTADYMTDYQARRLKTRIRRKDGSVQLVHTNDATAFALGRIMVAIIENYQTEDMRVVVPDVLKDYMKKEIL